ncbi:LysR family transcriptional regulator [Paraburkholderia terricola]|uniref:LysR family transcriptional regulator of abg operon n=1 Tax=Paraburkholderia terricola TaxID=169427 RepID=A0ABU1LV01_9BURK|nr:LysR substrate-binding domain-containing protein [Paraburkholderia terricola]MDR6410340.1 LysR family transcriptional regulator of abg operon [Paraburkholderia terricola]MDR6481500.1 LysR family transcriptional regulator of abg operon [Paraburkholderia terricola]
MKYPQVLAFVSVARLGSIRAAARALNVSQAAVTKTLRLLEEDLGVTLFSRGVGGAVPTAAGQSLLPRATLIVEQMKLLDGDVSLDNRGRVAMGMSPMASTCLLPFVLPDFLAQRPGAPLRIVDGALATVLPGLRDGTLDFGVCTTFAESIALPFRFDPWLRQQAVVIAHREHPAARGRCTLDKLTGFRWVSGGMRISTQPPDVGVARVIEAPQNIESQNAAATWAVLKHAQAIAVTTADLAGRIIDPEIVTLDLDTPLPDMTVGLVTRSDAFLSPNAQLMAEMLKDRAMREYRQTLHIA